MNFIEKSLVRKVLKPQVHVVGEDHVDLKFSQFDLIRKVGSSYLSHLSGVMEYLPGVSGCELNESEGTLAVTFDSTRTDPKKIARWFECAVEAGLKASDELDLSSASGDEIIGAVKKYLLPQVSQF